MKKVISFSLWGSLNKYNVGAVRNAELAPQIYPGWVCRFYVSADVPKETVEKLESFEHTEVIVEESVGDWFNSSFWRFITIDEDDVEINISRDCDSRLNLREKKCVDEFMDSDKKFHMMLDHPFHNGIMAGMWGIKKGLVDNMSELVEDWKKNGGFDGWQTDQSFLNRIISPLVHEEKMIHDSINLKNFPSDWVDWHFVGEVFDEGENRADHYGVLCDHVKGVEWCYNWHKERQ